MVRTGVLLAALTAADNTSVFAPVSPPADEIRGFFYLVTAVTGVIFVLVGGTLVYCIVCFRRRPGDDAEPPQVYGSKPIEVAWTVAPLLTVFVLFLVVVRTVAEIRRLEPPPGTAALHVTVVGRQWWWEYEVRRWQGRELRVKTANELHVPVNARVIFELQSADVIHSYWLPRLAGKTDVIPGRVNRLWVEAREPGVFLGQCAEYCGTQHANMLLRVVAEPAEDFERWLEHQAQPARDVADAAEGKRLFLAHACVSCHTVRGTTAKGTFGPDLTHLMSRQTLAAGMVDNGRDALVQWVDDPQVIKPGCWMPSMHLGRAEVEGIVSYLRTLE